jgi:hypothetical protein
MSTTVSEAPGSSLQITPMTGVLGAEIGGVDLSGELSANTIAASTDQKDNRPAAVCNTAQVTTSTTTST